MICPNCGADMEQLEHCPYCGTENEAVARHRYEKEISGIYVKIAALLRLPVEQVRSITKKLIIGAVTLVCVAVLALLGAFVYSKIAPEVGYRAQNATVEKLEALCDAGDLDAMNTMLEDMDDHYKAVYDKYTILGGLHEDLLRVEEDLPECIDLVTGYPEGADVLNYDLYRLFRVLLECQRLEDAGWVYEEAETVALLRERANTLLTEVLPLTEEEIALGLEMAAQEDPDYTELSRLIAQRLEDAP